MSTETTEKQNKHDGLEDLAQGSATPQSNTHALWADRIHDRIDSLPRKSRPAFFVSPPIHACAGHRLKESVGSRLRHALSNPVLRYVPL